MIKVIKIFHNGDNHKFYEEKADSRRIKHSQYIMIKHLWINLLLQQIIDNQFKKV